MLECIDKPREEVSKYAPKIITMMIDPDKIRDVIGSGGKVINKIIEETGVKIDIEDDGSVSIAAENVESAYKAKRIIESIVKEIEVGEIILGKVVRIESYGAFIKLSDNTDGLLHISQIDSKRIEKVEDVLKMGDEVLVKVIGIDEKGKIKLSRKAAMQQKEN